MTDIERIKELLPKITKGEWAGMAGIPTNVLADTFGLRVARCDFDGDMDHPECRANAEFIALCRNNIAALIEDLQLKNDMLAALKHTIVFTIGGVDYEGNPTSEINYLQRLRILIEKEQELERLKEELKRR